MSVGGAPGGATRLAQVLAEFEARGVRPVRSRDDLLRTAVVALRSAAGVDRAVAEAFDALLSLEYGEPAEEESHGPTGDAAVVVDALSALDRAREDLYRLLEAWAGREALRDVAPVLTVEPAPVGAVVDADPGGPEMFVVRDAEFRMPVPRELADDPVLLMAAFSEAKNRARAVTGGDFGPDAARPEHYRRCPALASGDPEDCSCLSGPVVSG